MENKSPFDLSDKQKVAFRLLEAAYKNCLKEGIVFVNSYGSLEAYNKKWVAEYADASSLDENDENIISTSSNEFWCPNNFTIPYEWADDKHLIKLTPLGKKIYDSYFK